MKKYFVICLTVICYFLTSNVFSQASYPILKAVLTFQFAENVTWDNEKDIRVFKIGVYGETEGVTKELKKIAEDNKIKGRKVVVSVLNDLKSVDQVDLVYVGKIVPLDAESIWGAIEKKNVLLVTDRSNDEKFIMLNILEDEGKKSLTFQINRANLILEGFSTSSELLLLGGSEVDVRELYKDMRLSLTNEREKVKEQLELIDGQKQEISLQKEELVVQNRKLDLMFQNMEFLKGQIKDRESELLGVNDSIASNNKILQQKSQQISFQELELQNQLEIYEDQNTKLHKQKKNIQKNKDELKQLLAESKKQKGVINYQKEVLSDKDTLIQTQEKSLYYIIMTSVVLLLLGLSIYRAYYAKKKANVTLEARVEERTVELSAANRNLQEEIVEREIVQHKLRESEKNYKDIYNATTDAIIIYSPQSGDITDVNETFVTMFGYNDNESRGLNISSIIVLDDAFGKEDLNKIKSGSLEEDDRVLELKTKDKSSRGFWSEVVLSTTMINKEPRVMAVIRDISRRKKVEVELGNHRNNLELLVRDRTIELEDSKNQAEAANKTKSEFLSNMSHELRTPLNAILGYAQILQIEHNLTLKQKENLSTIYTSGAHLLTLINEILDFGKVESGRMEVVNGEFNLDQLLRNVVNIISVKAEEKNLYLNFEAVNTLPQIVSSDEQKLRQILLNLLSNSVKYNDEGGVNFSVRLEKRNRLIFEIKDTGIGIPKDKQSAIFEPFIQISRTKKFVEGTGLGLPITKKLIDLLGGKISLQSILNEGSTFTVEMPVEVVSSLPAIDVQVQVEVTGYKGEKKRVLIVDDNVSNLLLIKDILEPIGFEVFLAEDGLSGIEKAKELKPDLLLLDYLMPDIDGFEVTSELKRMNELFDMRIIGMSATVTQRSRKGSFTHECDGFVVKPVDLNVFLEQVRIVLNIEWETLEHEKKNQLIEQLDKIPEANILLRFKEYASIGDFNSIDQLMLSIQEEDVAYASFCEKVKGNVKRYDSDSIISYVEDLLVK